MTPEKLVSMALEAMQRAYAPYSGYKVGAALLCRDGSVVCGANIENAAYGPSNCAERTAIFTAVFEGKREFEAIAVVGGKDGVARDFFPPCGVCRQVMLEFCDPDLYGKAGRHIQDRKARGLHALRLSRQRVYERAVKFRKAPVER